MNCPEGYSCNITLSQVWTNDQSYWFSVFVWASLIAVVVLGAMVVWRMLK